MIEADKLFNLFLLLLPLRLMKLVKLKLVVIIRKKCYLISETPCLVPQSSME
jgi:hypothetical protein